MHEDVFSLIYLSDSGVCSDRVESLSVDHWEHTQQAQHNSMSLGRMTEESEVSDLIQSSQIFSKSLTANTRIVTIIQTFRWLK